MRRASVFHSSSSETDGGCGGSDARVSPAATCPLAGGDDLVSVVFVAMEGSGQKKVGGGASTFPVL